MSHCIVCSPDESVDDTYAVFTDMASLGDVLYATTPMPAFRPVFQQPDEEVYASFEEAISERVLAVNRQLSHLGRAHSRVRQSVSQEEYGRSSREGGTLARVGNVWQSGVPLLSLALMLVLLGFDLMGLLVLHVH
ncbi:MAG TPA: hypothetical protein VF026_16950 [Ktedonobacteraceae bacterium]